MSDATHALCPRCNSHQPMVWTWVKKVTMHPDGHQDEFEGGKVDCRTCKFEITQIGIAVRREPK